MYAADAVLPCQVVAVVQRKLRSVGLANLFQVGAQGAFVGVGLANVYEVEAGVDEQFYSSLLVGFGRFRGDGYQVEPIRHTKL